MKRTLFYLATLLILSCCSSISKEPKSIEYLIEKAMTDNSIPSLSVGIIKNGKVDLVKGYGSLSRKDSIEVNANSIFQMASQSKMFTGIIANNLIVEGVLDINRSITEYLPKEINENDKKAFANITLKHILNHTAGIPNDACLVYRDRIDGEAWLNGYSKDQLIADINNLKLEFQPDAKFQYSNSGYAIAGFILEQVSGLSYEALLKKYVADTYNLKNTVVNLSNTQKLALVTPYRKDNRKIETQASIMGMATPASAVYSNTADLTKILLEQLKAYREGNIQNPLVLTNETTQMGNGLEYGFGLIRETKGENIKYGHGGDADGFACEYFFNPEANTAVVLLTSSGGPWVGELADNILNNLNEQS